MKIKSNKIKIGLFVASTLILAAGLSGYFHITKKSGKSAPVAAQSSDNPNLSGQPLTNPDQNQIIQTAVSEIPMPDLSNLQAPIFMYHYIRDYSFEKDTVGTKLSVSPTSFARQLDQIANNGYKTITFGDLKAGRIPDKPIILTFDDGYKDFYLNAYPELKKRNMTAVTYIIANVIGNDNYMSASDLIEISQYGIEVDSHTLSHPDLSTLSLDKAKNEITESKSIIEKITNQPVISFCYPSGKYNEQIVELVKGAGYIFATTTHLALGSFDNFLLLKRLRIETDTNISPYLK